MDAHCTDKIINKDIFSLVQLVNNNCFNSHSLDCIHETHDHSSGFSVVLHAVIEVMQKKYNITMLLQQLQICINQGPRSTI